MRDTTPHITRQSKRLTSVMDSDSNVPLSNYAGMSYLRKEIARLEKFVADKTARVQPSTSSPAAAGRRSIPRILTAVPLTRRLPQPHRRPSSDKRHEVLDGVRCRSAKERRERHTPTRLNDRPDVRIPRHWRHGVQIGAGRTSSGFANEINLN